jgi:uncharacterized protein YbaR (Trm112 family)
LTVDLDPQLLEIIRCPACLGTFADPADDEIACTECGRSYPIRNGVPVLLVDEARRPAAD